MKNRFTDEQITSFFKEAAAGTPVKQLCRKHGLSDKPFHWRRTKFGGMEVADAARLLNLLFDNSQLKKLLAEAHLDNEMLVTVLRGKR